MMYPSVVALVLSAMTMASFSAGRPTEMRDEDRALHEAVITGTALEVGSALAQGGDARYVDRYGNTLLMHAAVRGTPKIVDALLAAGADPDRRNEEDETAIFFAARGCSEPIAKRLIARRVEVNLRNQARETPLMVAAENGCMPVVRALLAVPRIDLFAADEWGHTALRYMDVNWINGLDMDSAELARDFLLKAKGREPLPKPKELPLGPALAPSVAPGRML